MIKIYSPMEVNMTKVDNRDTTMFWDYPLEELEDLLDNDEAMYVLWQDRLIEISDEFLDENNEDDGWDEESNLSQHE